MRGTIVATALAVGLVAGPTRAPAQEAGGGIRVDSIAVESNRRVTRATILNTASIPLKSPIG